MCHSRHMQTNSAPAHADNMISSLSDSHPLEVRHILLSCAALLQEMQFGTAATAGGTAWGATIPAFWGRSAINADDGKFTQDSNITQVLGCCPERISCTNLVPVRADFCWLAALPAEHHTLIQTESRLFHVCNPKLMVWAWAHGY